MDARMVEEAHRTELEALQNSFEERLQSLGAKVKATRKAMANEEASRAQHVPHSRVDLPTQSRACSTPEPCTAGA